MSLQHLKRAGKASSQKHFATTRQRAPQNHLSAGDSGAAHCVVALHADNCNSGPSGAYVLHLARKVKLANVAFQARAQDAPGMSRMQMQPQGSWPLCPLNKMDMQQLIADVTSNLAPAMPCLNCQAAAQAWLTPGERAAGAPWRGSQGVGRGRVHGAGGWRHPCHIRATGCRPYTAPPRSRRPAPARRTV